jgi:murein DD-endopeptidase MepM/ murein hydrolase activator NlpD
VKGIALFATPVLAVLAMVFGVVVVLAPEGRTPAISLAAAACVARPVGATSGVHLDGEQWKVARAIIRVGKSLGVPARGWVVALAAGMQESGLRPLPYGDRDSIGVFQQRTAWGRRTERIDPMASARMFFTGGHAGQRGLLDITGWQRMPVTVAAQEVQVSAYPDAYAKWEPLATKLVDQIAHVDASCESSGAWVFPLGRAHYMLTAGFGECGAHWADCHTGQDFAVPTGTPVATAGDGVVTFAGWDGPYGNAVHVLHPGGIATWYCHLSRLAVHRGTRVAAGEAIGLSGSTGNTTGPHLHLEIRLGASPTTNGAPVDPMPWLRRHHLL